jgi:SMODS and SLOG-associating 2TM effector domain 3/SMODS and SLOG-associating 2TM effector domain 1
MSAQPATPDSDADGSPQDIDLPGVHDAANNASTRGQKTYLILSAARLIALFVAAVAGALGLITVVFDLFGVILLVAFIVAAISEAALIRFQPERDWYSGRAIAESTKTLAWRFAVKGNPFGPTLTSAEAESLLRKRIGDVLTKGKDRLDVGLEPAIVTDSMRRLRESNVETRRATYLKFRTKDQRQFYSTNAKRNKVRATSWRFGLLAGEILAVVAAAVTLGRGNPFDFAGVIAALVASGAAWLAIKQYSQITSAYRVAAIELAIQESVLESVDEDRWPQAVADAEEAISREHTMWLASRGEEPRAKP